MISTLQISAVLDYGKVYSRRICKGIKTNESLLLYLDNGGHGDHLTRLFDGHRGFYDNQ